MLTIDFSCDIVKVLGQLKLPPFLLAFCLTTGSVFSRFFGFNFKALFFIPTHNFAPDLISLLIFAKFFVTACFGVKRCGKGYSVLD